MHNESDNKIKELKDRIQELEDKIEELEGKTRQRERIDKPCVLAVEGDDERVFLTRIAKREGLQEKIQIWPFGGRSSLPDKMRAIVTTPGFSQNVVSLGVVMDAEENADGAYQSVCGALESAKLSAKREKLVPVPEAPKLDILILPGDNRRGALETVCLDSVEDKPAMTCVNEFSECVKKEWIKELRRGKDQGVDGEEREPPVAKLHKMRAHAFLASIYEKPEIRLGEAAGKENGWDLSQKAFDEIKAFLNGLVES